MMANGPWHYAEAERAQQSALSADVANVNGYTGWSRIELLKLADVHATLALAAATLESVLPGTAGEAADKWKAATT